MDLPKIPIQFADFPNTHSTLDKKFSSQKPDAESGTIICQCSSYWLPIGIIMTNDIINV